MDDNNRSLTMATKEFISFWEECISLKGKKDILFYTKKMLFYARVDALELNTCFNESIKEIDSSFTGGRYKIDLNSVPGEYHLPIVFILMKRISGNDLVSDIENLFPSEVSKFFNIAIKLLTADSHYSDEKKIIEVRMWGILWMKKNYSLR